MKFYIVTRRDIPPGLMLAQSVHAARAFVDRHPDIDREWFTSSNNLACLEVPDEAALTALVKKAVCRDVPYAVFREPDMGGEITSVAFGAEAKRIVSNLPLALRAPPLAPPA